MPLHSQYSQLDVVLLDGFENLSVFVVADIAGVAPDAFELGRVLLFFAQKFDDRFKYRVVAYLC